MKAQKFFFIYVAKNSEWQQRQNEDWEYVSSMSRFYNWWLKRFFGLDIAVEADILPVISGRLFDRMSINYLARDHSERGKEIFHLYLAYFKPMWTDCNTEGYFGNNFGMIYWERPKESIMQNARDKFFADTNCHKVSHILAHAVIQMKGKSKKEYFEAVHDLWDRHVYNDLPFLYFNGRYDSVRKDDSYRYVTLDPRPL